MGLHFFADKFSFFCKQIVFFSKLVFFADIFTDTYLFIIKKNYFIKNFLFQLNYFNLRFFFLNITDNDNLI